MELKLTFLVLIPLFTTAASQQSIKFTPSGSLNNQGYVPNSALRPWGTVPSPITSHGNQISTIIPKPLLSGNPTSTTLSPFRPFGTVPPPRGHRPQNRPWHPTGPPNPRYPINYGHRYSARRLAEPNSDNSGSAVNSDLGVTLPPLLFRSGVASEPGVTLPPLSSTSSAGNELEVTTLPTFATEGTNSSNRGGSGRDSSYIRIG